MSSNPKDENFLPDFHNPDEEDTLFSSDPHQEYLPPPDEALERQFVQDERVMPPVKEMRHPDGLVVRVFFPPGPEDSSAVSTREIKPVASSMVGQPPKQGPTIESAPLLRPYRDPNPTPLSNSTPNPPSPTFALENPSSSQADIPAFYPARRGFYVTLLVIGVILAVCSLSGMALLGFQWEYPGQALRVWVNSIMVTDQPGELVTSAPGNSGTGILLEPTPAPMEGEQTPVVGVGTGTPRESSILQMGNEMVYVPGGTFSMGSLLKANEQPVHDVTLDAFYIDKLEVSNAAWADCVKAGICTEPGSTRDYANQPYYNDPAFASHPVVYISWDQANRYCAWRGIRLPTEAEWEMAARWNPTSGSTTTYPWGDDWDPTKLNYCDASCLLSDATVADPLFDDGHPQMGPTGSFPAGSSPVGAMDMAGNVAEWTADWYSASFYSLAPLLNPIGPELGTARVVRGGGWSVGRDGNRSAARAAFGPASQVAGIGVRCAAPLDSSQR